MLYLLRISSSRVELRNVTGSTVGLGGGDIIAIIDNFNPSISSVSTNNLLAYRPNYSDSHTSGLAAIFVNIERVFPCIAGTFRFYPVCKTFTSDEDGFRNGRAIIDVADYGNHFTGIFGRGVSVFAFAIAGCSTWNDDCFPNYIEHTIVCLLPRSRCGG